MAALNLIKFYRVFTKEVNTFRTVPSRRWFVEYAVHEKLWGLTSLGYAGKLTEFAARSPLKHGDGQGSSLCTDTLWF
jgi:hypothetical protein